MWGAGSEDLGTAAAEPPIPGGRFWSDDPEDSFRELYLAFPAWEDASAASGWAERDEGGVLLNLADVTAIEFESRPEAISHPVKTDTRQAATRSVGWIRAGQSRI